MELREPRKSRFNTWSMYRKCQVAICGAGPIGLFLALALQKQGVDVVIIERQSSVYPLPRAVAFDHESRRLMGSVDLGPQMSEVLEHVIGKGGQDGINFVWRDRDLNLIVDLYWENESRSGLPMFMGFCQPQLVAVLEQTVRDRKIPLIRGYALKSMENTSEAVTSRFVPSKKQVAQNGCSNGTGEEEELVIEASYLVGCDGANSTVRDLANIEYTHLDFKNNDWLIADLVLKDGYIPPKVVKIGASQICDPARPTTCVFSGKGRKRMEFMRMPNEAKSDLTDDLLYDLLGTWGYTRDNCCLERKAIYTFEARWADEFFKDKILLAGDALHLMPPFIGQGLNSGFRDVAAIAWRLPLMLSGKASPRNLLESYQAERLPHIRKLTEFAITLGKVICETDPENAKVVHKDLRDNPPPGGYDPPLGQPGILTTQATSGMLSMQRKLLARSGEQEPRLFDDLYGYGWFLIIMAENEDSLPESLHAQQRDFFCTQIGGKIISISPRQDYDGQYRAWFADEMDPDSVVLVRPDFYIFGHCPLRDVNRMVSELSDKLGYKAI